MSVRKPVQTDLIGIIKYIAVAIRGTPREPHSVIFAELLVFELMVSSYSSGHTGNRRVNAQEFLAG